LGKVYWWPIMYERINFNNKSIHIFEGLVDYEFQTKVYIYIKNSLFGIDGYDNSILEERHLTLVSNYTEKDLHNAGFILPKDITEVISFNDYDITSIIVNLCKPDDIFHTHIDDISGNGLTLLYYANIKWDLEWGGDTLFLNPNTKDIMHTSQYKPGKFVIFDGSIPHLIRPSTRLATDYRFTLAIRFRKK
jgi:hypothetical protein